MSDRLQERRVIRQFWCATCGAQPGEHCRTRTGREAATEHDPRREAMAIWVDGFKREQEVAP